MSTSYLLIVIILAVAVLSLPALGYMPASYGYYPIGGLGTILLILVILALLGKI